jgi:hypothetical protein
MDRDAQREINALQDVQQLGSLFNAMREAERLQQVALVRHWEQQCSLEEHVTRVAAAVIDSTQMKRIDSRHKETLAMERYGQELSRGLIARLGGDRERFEALVTAAVDHEHERRAQEPANTLRAAHKVLPKSYTFTLKDGSVYKIVPDYDHKQGGFLGRYFVMRNGEKVGYMDYDSRSEYWKVPNHGAKKDLRKAFADFLNWQKNPRRRMAK